MVVDEAEALYKGVVRRRILLTTILASALAASILYSIHAGLYKYSFRSILDALRGAGSPSEVLVIRDIRLPRIIAAVVVGAGMSVAGAITQCVLENPLATPFTLGVAHGAMFGAALAIVGFGFGEVSSFKIIVNNPYIVVASAFTGAVLGVSIMLILAGVRGLTPESMILAGIALSFLFTAATMVIQYFASELELASIVYWTFGDLGRPYWRDDLIMSIVVAASIAYYASRAWDYNVLLQGEDTARSLGVNVKILRLAGVYIAALVTAVCVSFVGIIGFIGLVCPHACRLLIGSDYRYLIPSSALMGSLLLTLSDTLARTIMSPITLPVGIVIAFIGVPMFIYLLSKLGVQR